MRQLYQYSVRITHSASVNLALQGSRRGFRRDLCNAGAHWGMSIAARAYRSMDMMIRHTKLVLARTLTVLLTACSVQSGNDRKGVASAPVAVSAPAAVSAEAPPGAGPAVAETAPVNAAAPATAPAATGALEAVPATPSAGGPSAPEPAAAREPAHHEVTLPAGTSLPIRSANDRGLGHEPRRRSRHRRASSAGRGPWSRSAADRDAAPWSRHGG